MFLNYNSKVRSDTTAMTDTSDDDQPRKRNARVHHLAHLVNAITTQLSTCLSLNSLLTHCITHMRTSESMAARAEGYHTSLALSQKSLTTFAHFITRQFSIAPGSSDFFEPGVEGHTLKEGGYDSLKVAARECTKIPDLLQSIQDHQDGLDDMNQSNQWQGWPKCNALDDLADLNRILLGLRDSGGNSDVGWCVVWKLLVNDSV
jgi:hypothetical protein